MAQVIAEGERLLQEGRWEEARRALEAALGDDPRPEALDGLGVALWWLGELDAALHHREGAFAAFRRRGDLARAVRIAVWLAREHLAVYRNHNAANGWLTRAQTLIEDLPSGPVHGWIQLLRAERAAEPRAKEGYAEAALEIARRHGDADCEIHALALRGLARVSAGRPDEGIADLDQAMAGAVAGEGRDLQTLGDAFCVMMSAAELLGDFERFAGWAELIEKRLGRAGSVPVLSFCRACCGELFAAAGRWEEAERELVASLEALEEAGHRSRCVEPAARLAHLRIRQGRLEEAEELVARYVDEPEMVQARASLYLAQGVASAAARVIERRLHRTGEASLETTPLQSLLVRARIATSDVAGAREAAEALRRFADASGLAQVRASALRAAGDVAMADGDERRAARHLEEALGVFETERMRVDAATTRLDLARALAGFDREGAVQEAREAVARLEELGARRDADAAAALLRSLGVRGRTGPKGLGTLTAREREVLGLLRYGLSNADIGGRLYISPRTVGHHVSRILAKLGVRTRAEAAALAAELLGHQE